MAARGVLRTIEHGQVGFWCPGCEMMHVVTIEAGHGPASWGFNGDYDRPAFTPSVLVRGGHYMRGETSGNCYCDFQLRYPDREEPGFKCYRCHSFVGCNGAQPGEIIFLSDCTHALAGRTVPLLAPPD